MVKKPAPGVEEPKEEISEEISKATEIDASDWRPIGMRSMGLNLSIPLIYIPKNHLLIGCLIPV